MHLALLAFLLPGDHHAHRDSLIAAGGRPGTGLRRRGTGRRGGGSRGEERPRLVEPAGGQRAGEFHGHAARRGPSERADLAQRTQNRPDPEQAGFQWRFPAFPEVLVQPPVARSGHRTAQLALGQQPDVALGGRPIHLAGRRPAPRGRS